MLVDAFAARGLAEVDGRGDVWTMHGGTDSAEWYVAALERALDVLPAEVFPAGFDPRAAIAQAREPGFAILSPISITACGRKPPTRPGSSSSVARVMEGRRSEPHGRGAWQDEPMATMAELVRARAGDPNVGLRFEDSSWTWAEVVEAAADAPRSSARHAPADAPFHVGVLLDNIPEFWFTLCGAALAGATVVGINPTRRGAELARDIAHTDCAFVLTETGAPRAVRSRGHSPRPAPLHVVDEPEWAEALAPFAECAGARRRMSRPATRSC